MVDVKRGSAWDKNILGDAPEEEPIQEGGGLMKAPQQALFDGDTKSVTVTHEVNLLQLLNEVEDRLGDRSHFQVVMEMADHKAPVSEMNPLIIHVHPAEADMRTVRGAVDSHSPDPDYGRSDADKKLEELKGRLRDGDLSLKDLNTILRSVIS
jgi:hypothetical protein